MIDHEKGYMQSKETVDVYCTKEPQSVFHQRISFCLNVHNQSVKAMRYPPKSYNKDLESAEVGQERAYSSGVNSHTGLKLFGRRLIRTI